jgi:hypothetical protein
MHSFEKIILKYIYSIEDPVDVYFFHEKYRLSAGQISFFIKKYTKNHCVNYEENKISITQKGRSFVIKKKKELYLDQSKEWKKIPKDFKNLIKLGLNELCIPPFSTKDLSSFIKYYNKNIEEK